MPLLDDLKTPPAATTGFKKKAYRSWNLLEFDESNPEGAEASGEADGSAAVPGGGDAGAVDKSKAPLGSAVKGKRNRAQKGDQQGTTTGHNRAQTSDQPGTNKNNRAQKGDQQGTTTGHNRAQRQRARSSGLSAELKSILDDGESANLRHPVPKTTAFSGPPAGETPINRAQKSSVPGSFENCARLEEPLCPVSPPLTGHKSPSVPGLFENCALLQPGTNEGVNRAQTFSQPGTEQPLNRAQKPAKNALPSSRQMLAILDFMVSQQQSTGLEHTPRLKRSTVAMSLGISLSGIKNQLARLCEGNYLERVDARDGRGESGTVYRVPAQVIKALQQVANRAQRILPTGHTETANRAQDSTSTGHKNRAQKQGTTHGSSSSFITTTTTATLPPDAPTDRDLYERFREAINRFDCQDLIGPNDVMQTWRKGVFDNVDDLIESVEHVTAYVRSPQGDGLKAKRGWIMKTLAAGYFGKPEGFVSFADRQLEAKRQRASERQAQRQVAFETDFELWLADLAPDTRKKILHDQLKGASHFVSPSVGKRILRNHFAQEQGLFEFVTDDDRP